MVNQLPLDRKIPAFKHSTRPTFPRRILFLFTFLRTLLHFLARIQNSTLLFSIDSALFAKNHRGWGHSQCSNVSRYPQSLHHYFLSSPVRPIAANRPWCHNWQRRENSSPSGETTPLPPVSKNRERTSGTVRRRSRSHPDSVGVASRAWVQRSNAGFRVCTCKPRAKLDRSRVARATFPCRTESALASVKDAGKCRVGKAGSVRLGQCPFLGPR